MFEIGKVWGIECDNADIEGFPLGRFSFTGTATNEFKIHEGERKQKFVSCYDIVPSLNTTILWITVDKDVGELNELFTKGNKDACRNL